MAAGGGDFERALGARLAAHFGHVHVIDGGFLEDVTRIRRCRRDRHFSGKKIGRLLEARYGNNFNAFHDRSLPGVGFWQNQSAKACSLHTQREGKSAADRADFTIQSEFTGECEFLELT